MTEKDFKQVFIVNKDLKMRKGKIAVQVAHGEVLYMEHMYTDDTIIKNHSQWRFKNNSAMKKIVLKATEQQLNIYLEDLKLSHIWCAQVFDLGLTQVPENSFTCIVVEPLEIEKCDKLFSELQLL